MGDEPSGGRVHNGLARSFSESIVKVGTVVLSQVVSGERLTAVLVDTLENLEVFVSQSPSASEFWSMGTHLVAGGVAQAREKRGEFAADRSRRIFLEDDLVEALNVGNLAYIVESVPGETHSEKAIGSLPGSGCSSSALRWCRPSRRVSIDQSPERRNAS